MLYNNFNNRFPTVKDSLQKQQELQLEEYQKQMEQDNGSRSQHESQYDFYIALYLYSIVKGTCKACGHIKKKDAK